MKAETQIKVAAWVFVVLAVYVIAVLAEAFVLWSEPVWALSEWSVSGRCIYSVFIGWFSLKVLMTDD